MTETQAPVRRATIASAAATVMFFYVLSRVTGLVREGVIAARFGASADLDAYLAAFRVPDLLFQLVAGGALGSAFIPTFSSYWTRHDRAGAWLLFSRVLNLVTLTLTVVAGLAALFAPQLVARFIAPGFPPPQQAETAALMRWMLFGTVLFGASGLVMGALNAMQHFLLPAVAPVLYNLAIIGGALFLAPKFGVFGLVVGVVSGAISHLAVQLPGLWWARARYYLSFAPYDSGVREVARLMGPRMLGLFFVQINFLVNTILASGLDPGSLVALNYAWLIMLLPQGIFAQSLAAAAFPTMAAQVAAGELGEMRHTFSRTLRFTLFLTLPSAVGLIVLGRELVAALFQHGAFDASGSARVAYGLAFYAVGLTGHAMLEIVVRAFYALHDTLTPVMVGVAAMVVNIILSLVWVGWLGYGGLALANSLATTGEAFLLLWLLRRPLQGVDGEQIWPALVKQAAGAVLMGAVLWLWLDWVEKIVPPTSALVQPWLLTLGGLLLGALVYGGVAVLLGSDELRFVLLFGQRQLARFRAH
jgi:putative peptidoglycan lipid II flippase